MSSVWSGFTDDNNKVERKIDMTDMVKIAECPYAIFHDILKPIFKSENIQVMHRYNKRLPDAEKTSKPELFYHGFIYVHTSCVERAKAILDKNNINCTA